MSYFTERYGPWVVIAGASQGIGEQFARQLVARGLNIMMIARWKRGAGSYSRGSTQGICSRSRADILHRWYSEDLYCVIPCVISNHENLRSMVDWYDIPFHYVPVNKDNKTLPNEEILRLIQHYQSDCIVLARYMQIVTTVICQTYPNLIINIHHIFCPPLLA